MSEATKSAIDKLRIIQEMTDDRELKQTIKVVIELARSFDTESEMGFASPPTRPDPTQ